MVTICKDGQWSDTKVKCPSESGDVSCTADKKCGECLTDDSKNCENKEVVVKIDGVYEENVTMGMATMCKDGKWTAEPVQCPEMNSCILSNNPSESKCGECMFNTHKGCKELRGREVSCHIKPDCTGDECYQCGLCQNTDKFLCLARYNVYGYELATEYEEARAECKNGFIQSVKYCQQNTCRETGNCAAPKW